MKSNWAGAVSAVCLYCLGACSSASPEFYEVYEQPLQMGASSRGGKPDSTVNDAGSTAFSSRAELGSLSYVGLYPYVQDDRFIESIAFSPDGRHAYVGVSGREGVALFDRNGRDGALTHERDYTNSSVTWPHAIVVSPDGRHVYVSTEAEGGVVWFERHLADGTLTYKGIANTNTLFGVSSMAVTADGRFLYAVSMSANTVAWFHRDMKTGEPKLQGSEVGSNDDPDFWGPFAIALSPHARHAYVIHFDAGTVISYERDGRQGRLLRKAAVRGPSRDEMSDALALAVSPDGKSIYVAANHLHNVSLLSRDTSTGQLAYVESYPGKVDERGRAVVVSPDGKSVYVPGDHIAWYARDGITGKLTMKEDIADARMPGVHSLVFSPDGRNAYVLCSAGIAWLRAN